MPPPDSDEAFSETTRELRRTLFVAETIELVVSELVDAFEQPDFEIRVRGVLVRHLEEAWNDGARREADLRSAVNTLRSQVESLKKQLHAALAQVSRLRIEPE